MDDDSHATSNLHFVIPLHIAMVQLLAVAVLLLVHGRISEGFAVYYPDASVARGVHVPRATVDHSVRLRMNLMMSSKSEEETSNTTTNNNEEPKQEEEEGILKTFLKKEYSAFATLLSLNPDIWELLEKEDSVTIFAPTNQAFDSLGKKRLLQLRDIRNEETAQKIGQYHVVLGDAISSARLRTEDWTVQLPKQTATRPIKVSGLVTMGGEVPVGRPKAKDGPLLQRLMGSSSGQSGEAGKANDICIGPNGRIQKSYKLADGACYVHEMDNFISPDILWRYCDQLRIPGF